MGCDHLISHINKALDPGVALKILSVSDKLNILIKCSKQRHGLSNKACVMQVHSVPSV